MTGSVTSPAPPGTAPAARIVLWRHGQTTWNKAGRFQGQTDVPLDAAGHAQAQRAAVMLARMEPSLIVSSDLSRAHETARALADVTGLHVTLDPDLRETNGGHFQGLTGDEIRAQHPGDWAAWASGDPHFRNPGGGESRTDVAARMLAAVLRAANQVGNGLAVLATHGGAARLAVAQLIGLPLERVGSLGVISNTAWTMVERRRGPHADYWALVEHNARTLPEPVTIEEG
ncbi:MAG: histidine phosphatase family protein [Jiangellales bacterium]